MNNATQDTVVRSLLSGLAGAVALNVLHETVRRLNPEAPQVQKLGERSLVKGLEALGQQPPAEDELYWPALAGDLTANTLYYSLIGVVPKPAVWPWGAVLGALAGAGAVTLAEPLGLGDEPVAKTPERASLTVAWYVVGGLVTAGVYQLLQRRT